MTWTEETRARLEVYGGAGLKEDIRAALAEIERLQGVIDNILCPECGRRADHCAEYQEQAQEIERLRSAACEPCPHIERAEKAEAEIERLSKMCCVCEGDCCRLAKERLAEIERLRAELRDLYLTPWKERAIAAEARVRTLEAAHAECALREADLLKELAERTAEVETARRTAQGHKDNHLAAEAEVERLREQLRLSTISDANEMARANDAEARVRTLEAALAEWRRHDSAPDCVACAVLDAATCGALRKEGK